MRPAVPAFPGSSPAQPPAPASDASGRDLVRDEESFRSLLERRPDESGEREDRGAATTDDPPATRHETRSTDESPRRNTHRREPPHGRSEGETTDEGASFSADPFDDHPPHSSDIEPNTDLGQSILSSFGMQGMPALAPTGTSPAEPLAAAAAVSDAGAVVAEISASVAERVLVSDPGAGSHQQQEVRITLKDDVLPGTEVRVWREGGQVRVEFVTSSDSSASFLSREQASLQTTLHERLAVTDIAVNVTRAGGAEGESNDGRSRQRRNLFDEIEDTADHR